MALTQEKIVLLIALALFCVFSFFLRGFLSPGNLLTLVRGVSTLGILGVGMAVVVIGHRPHDRRHLCDVGRVDVSPGEYRRFYPARLALGYLFALAVGVANGLLI